MRRPHRAGRAATLIAALLALTFAGTACGDGPDARPTTPDTSATLNPNAFTAAEAIPGFAGYDRSVPDTIEAPGGVDIAYSLYRQTGTEPISARLEIRVYPTEEAAGADYPIQAEGWKAAPPGLFGANLSNVDSAPLHAFPDGTATGYIAQSRDGSGNRVFTDVYRIGRVIAVQHVLAADRAAANPIRNALSEAVTARLPAPAETPTTTGTATDSTTTTTATATATP